MSSHLWRWTVLLLLALPAVAAAQDDAPDLRDLRPYMMLVVDTSGSMERLPACLCVTPGCVECLPNCNLATTAGVPDAKKKNRWAVTLEALTGGFKDFQCETLDRTPANGMTYDIGYYLPYHQPWDCTATEVPLTNDVCNYTDPGVPTPLQDENGVLDTYATRVRFGLMTFDGIDTYAGASPLIAWLDFNAAQSESEQGLWSYGGKKPIHYPGCQFDYAMDTGSRNRGADEGALVSLDSCASPPCDMLTLNSTIQDQLLKARPYGGTPIAASLDDLYFHLDNDLSDTFGSCRNRFAMLITDGYPDDDYRTIGCGCTQNDDPGTPETYCGAPPNNDPLDMKCPYPTPEDAARDLVVGRLGDQPKIEQLFVVGLAINDADADVKTRLNTIAEQGGGEKYPPDDNVAFFADDLDTLVTQLDDIIKGVIKPVSRTTPVSSTAQTAGTASYQVSTGFELNTQVGEPWTGILERRRFSCNGNAVVASNLDDGEGDLFHETLNRRLGRDRKLWTVEPPGDDGDQHLFTSSGGSCTSSCTITDLNNYGRISYAELGLPDGVVAQRDEIKEWMYGESGSVRADKKLADIYHSTPAIVGSPQFDISDASFNLFRQTEKVSDRPQVLYVGSNDGILHAFAMDEWDPIALGFYGDGATIGAFKHEAHLDPGQELWGFVPPMFLDNLKDQLLAHQTMVDGSPVVKNVYFNRPTDSAGLQAAPSDTDYHTVLITGMRGGGKGYVALDVTDPLVPVFLWQFMDDDMGLSYGRPAIVQAVFDVDGGTDFAGRALAVLPGGKGRYGVGSGCDGVSQPSFRNGSGGPYTSFYEIPTGLTGNPIEHRRDLPCYENEGRAMYFVDVETGKLMKKIWDTVSDEPVLPAPIVSTPVMHQNAVGVVANQGFVVDAEGVIWRMDISGNDPKPDDVRDGWTMRPYHDIFWDKPADPITTVSHGEVSYERPILSSDAEGRLVVIVGTGDTDDFAKPEAQNRVVSLTQTLPFGTDEAGSIEDFRAAINWEKRTKGFGGFVDSELVTGSMALFQGQLFFASYISVANAGDPCDQGKGRLFSVDYIKRMATDRNGSNPETYGPLPIGNFGASDIAINVEPAQASPDLLVMGLGVTQRPTCTVVDPALVDVWNQSVYEIDQLVDPAIFLTAQSSAPGTGLNKKGSALSSIEVSLTRDQVTSKVLGWATSVD